MSIEVLELNKSRPISVETENASIELLFLVRGTLDQGAAYLALLVETPTTYTVPGPIPRIVLRRKGISVDPLGSTLWEGKATYGWQAATADGTSDDPDQDDNKPLGPEFSFDTTGGTQHVTMSLATISRTAIAGGTAPDYKGAINVTRDSVGGTDIIAPKLELSITLQKADLTMPYVRGLARATGKVNANTWYGFPAGELLFLGASGSSKPGEKFSITYKFGCGENLANITLSGSQLYLSGARTSGSTTVTMGNTTGINVGDRVYGTGIPSGATVSSITPNVSIVLSAAATTSTAGTMLFGSATGLVAPAKKAWEYLWCAYIDQTNANIMVQVPVAVFVEQVYRTVDYGSIF